MKKCSMQKALKSNGRKKPDISRILSLIVLIVLIVSVIGVGILMLLAPSDDAAQPGERPRSDYVLELLQCCFGVFAMFVPSFLEKKFHIAVPSRMMILYVVFLYCSIFLGEVRRFYYTVPHWDTMLHTFSGAMLGTLGFSMINLLNKTDRVPMNLSPAFVAVFTFCFALALGALWEIYEFTMDGIFKTNMQKFALEDGTPLPGHQAVTDTMKDLIVDTLGALIISIIGYISLKFQKGWIDHMVIVSPAAVPADITVDGAAAAAADPTADTADADKAVSASSSSAASTATSAGRNTPRP